MKHAVALLAAAACAAATEPEAPARTKVLVAWHSETNRTSALGRRIAAAAAQEAEVRALPVGQVSCDDLTWADGIALGSPVYWGTLSGGLKTFLDEVQTKCFGWPVKGGAVLGAVLDARRGGTTAFGRRSTRGARRESARRRAPRTGHGAAVEGRRRLRHGRARVLGQGQRPRGGADLLPVGPDGPRGQRAARWVFAGRVRMRRRPRRASMGFSSRAA
mmetsp:Transcript_24404/g.73233  ORF Transcript_24404/g.73233 Transcript_24404/m.73233 type:complete len:218 (+) Transcript_24404:118-771(+)